MIIESSPLTDYWLSTTTSGVVDDGMGPSRGSTRGAFGELLAEQLVLKKYDFIVQFVWKPKTPGAIQIISNDENNDEY